MSYAFIMSTIMQAEPHSDFNRTFIRNRGDPDQTPKNKV